MAVLNVNSDYNIGTSVANLLANSDFINRSVGMANSYEDIMFIVQALGREPISLLGKDYLYIFDHVRRNYNMGSNVMDAYHNDCPKFTFYKEKPTVRFADPYNDSLNLLDRWMPNMNFGSTSQRNILFSYAESDDDYTNNREIGTTYDIENANPGVNKGGISSFANVMTSCDMVKKTNDNFNHGKYKTLIARFHTNSMDSKDKNDITQTAVSEKYGMSHGRNLLSITNDDNNGYDNPYCRVWTYHHQYNQLARAIRPFGEAETAEELESLEQQGDYNTVGFRTIENKNYGFKGGSERLDKYGVLNYRNGLVNIAPTAKVRDYFEGKTDKKVTIKKCMFSIENLAWRSENIKMDEFDKFGLSPEQKGPLGGRIMWFPPYDLTFSEDVSVNWNQNQFIGRGEKVYTYTDTERRGNLSFTLLIDHPSILDYWTGHKRNGMTNQGVSLIPGNGGGVDEISNQENTLLRFFAGCEILSAKPHEYWNRDLNPQKEEDEEQTPMKNPPDTDTHKPEGKKVIQCVLYYPNNYSGADDYPIKESGVVNAVYYLMNGVGAQKYVNLNLDAADIPTQIDSSANHSGYEINGNISIVDKNLEADYDTIKKSYADTETSAIKAQYLTDEDGNRIGIQYGGQFYTLAKIVGSEAMPMGGANVKSNLTGKDHLWYRKRWYYRVDKAYENDELSNVESYLDTECFDLNGKNGYENIRKNLADAFGISKDDKDAKLISFADMFVALEGAKAEKILNGKFDSDNVSMVREIMDKDSGIKVTKVEFIGHASLQGNVKSNATLAKNRALTFKKWMDKMGFPNVENAQIINKEASPNKNNINIGFNNDESVKMWRSASVTIEYEKGSIEEASLAESSIADSGDTSVNKLDKVNLQNGLESLREIKPISIEEINKKKVDDWNDEFQKKADRVGKLDILSGKDYFNEKSVNYDNTLQGNKDGGHVNSVKNGVADRYDNEGEFFELLEKNDPFMHHLITDKIRYFDPAYHSISPEGFNARLTFLHQCTRQGSTVGGSDSQIGNTAYNLAFGRPPICVLRLGDFYNTKIVINSLSIQYEQAQWDLNPEGIGVMPMFAKVTIGFAFLGGSDLAGPISRLQNAVSFNYYANTSVYDNRAEMVQYDSDGKGREVKFKPYSYPDMVHNGEVKKKRKGVAAFDMPKATELLSNNDSSNSSMETVGYNIDKSNGFAITNLSQPTKKQPPFLSKEPQINTINRTLR